MNSSLLLMCDLLGAVLKLLAL